MTNEIYQNMKKHTNGLSTYATKDEDVKYLKDYHEDIRTPFFRDIDKIIYALSYIRYMDKTQVFTYKDNDHVQKRMIHVQYVSKIARTIGRALNLNEDLIEAAALGHDLGHTSFGHIGEKILNDISLELGEGYFNHNVNSVRVLTAVENYGKGLNISIQVLDAILCHNGEILSNHYEPKQKTIDNFLSDYENSYKDKEVLRKLCPMTLEGCVVRISDIIAYLGRDIEDARRLHISSFKEVPKEITDVLGNTNSDIINTIVLDIIKNSYDKPYIEMSPKVFKAIFDLKNFNYENIYKYSYTSDELKEIENMFRTIVNHFLDDIKNDNKDSIIFKSYLNNMSSEYLKNTPERIVLDYVSGMTDDFIYSQYQNISNKNN